MRALGLQAEIAVFSNSCPHRRSYGAYAPLLLFGQKASLV